MKLNGNRKSRLESLDGGWVELSSSSSTPFCLYISFHVFYSLPGRAALAFYSCNDYSVFLESDASRPRNTTDWRDPELTDRDRGTAKWPRALLQHRNIHHHKLVRETQRHRDRSVCAPAGVMVKLKSIVGKINDAWWFRGLQTWRSGEFSESVMLTERTYKLFHQRDNVVGVDVMPPCFVMWNHFNVSVTGKAHRGEHFHLYFPLTLEFPSWTFRCGDGRLITR